MEVILGNLLVDVECIRPTKVLDSKRLLNNGDFLGNDTARPAKHQCMVPQLKSGCREEDGKFTGESLVEAFAPKLSLDMEPFITAQPRCEAEQRITAQKARGQRPADQYRWQDSCGDPGASPEPAT